MSKERKQLLIGLILGILTTIITSLFSSLFMSEEVSNITANSSISLFDYIISGLYIFGIIYFLVLIINKKIDLNKHSFGILFFSIVFLIINIVTGVFGLIVHSNLKNVEKRQLPNIEYKEYTNKYICLIAFILSLVLMFVVSKHVNTFIGTLVIYISIFIMMIGVFYKQLIHDFKLFKEYFREYMSLSLKTWIKSLVVMITFGIIIQIATNTTQSNNQQTLQKMFSSYPIFVGLLSVIYAPIAEELMFRGVIRKFIKNKYIFIIISGILFGLLHVIDDSKTLAEFSYVILYSSLGMFLAGLYYKTNNLFSNISFHFFQNTLGLIGMIILYFL